jgi:hypothetical protein
MTRRIGSKPAWAKSSTRPSLKRPFTKIGLVEWLKVKALSSSPSTAKKKKKRKKKKNGGGKRNEKILPHVPMVAG